MSSYRLLSVGLTRPDPKNPDDQPGCAQGWNQRLPQVVQRYTYPNRYYLSSASVLSEPLDLRLITKLRTGIPDGGKQPQFLISVPGFKRGIVYFREA